MTDVFPLALFCFDLLRSTAQGWKGPVHLLGRDGMEIGKWWRDMADGGMRWIGWEAVLHSVCFWLLFSCFILLCFCRERTYERTNEDIRLTKMITLNTYHDYLTSRDTTCFLRTHSAEHNTISLLTYYDGTIIALPFTLFLPAVTTCDDYYYYYSMTKNTIPYQLMIPLLIRVPSNWRNDACDHVVGFYRLDTHDLSIILPFVVFFPGRRRGWRRWNLLFGASLSDDFINRTGDEVLEREGMIRYGLYSAYPGFSISSQSGNGKGTRRVYTLRPLYRDCSLSICQ